MGRVGYGVDMHRFQGFAGCSLLLCLSTSFLACDSSDGDNEKERVLSEESQAYCQATCDPSRDCITDVEACLQACRAEAANAEERCPTQIPAWFVCMLAASDADYACYMNETEINTHECDPEASDASVCYD